MSEDDEICSQNCPTNGFRTGRAGCSVVAQHGRQNRTSHSSLIVARNHFPNERQGAETTCGANSIKISYLTKGNFLLLHRFM